jgi:hypothetical protein
MPPSTMARHASDLGYAVDYVSEATLTFPPPKVVAMGTFPVRAHAILKTDACTRP